MLYCSLDENLNIADYVLRCVRRIYLGILSVNLCEDFFGNRTNHSSYRMVKIITAVLLFLP